MRIFKKTAAVLLAWILVEGIFSWMLEPVTFDHFLSMEKRKAQQENKEVDLVFFGDSRTIRTFYPDIFEEKIQGVELALNEGVNQQNIESTYYFMKDYLKQQRPRYAVVNLNYDYFLTTTKDPEMAKGLTLDRMSTVKGAAEYVWNCFSLQEYPNLLKSYRYRAQTENIPATLDAKFSKEYWQGLDVREEIHYVSKGYATWDLAYRQGNTGTPAGCFVWSADTRDDTALSYLDKIVQLCAQYDVKLYFAESPVTVGRLYAIEGYAEYEALIREKCEKLGVPFWNLNLWREDSISMYDPYFTDTEHLNDVGSVKTSERFADLLAAEIAGEDISDYFYPDYQTFQEQLACVGACDLSVWDADTQKEQIPWETVKDSLTAAEAEIAEDDFVNTIILYGTAFAAEGIEPEYCFQVTYDGGESYHILADYSEADVCILSKETLQENAEFRVDVRPKNRKNIHPSFRTTLD